MTTTSSVRLGAAAVLVAALVGVGAVPASAADDLSSGSWYYDRGHVQEAHDAGYTGKGVTIAVIDGPINTDVPMLQGADIEVSPKTICHKPDGSLYPPRSTDYAVAYHGTNTTAMIVGTGKTGPGQLPIRGVAPDARVLYYSTVGSVDENRTLVCPDANGVNQKETPMAEAITQAVDAHADIISVSIGTGVGINEALAYAFAHDVVVVGGLPDTQGAFTGDWPAAANGAVGVQAFDAAGNIMTTTTGTTTRPNDSNDVKVAAPGIGILQQGSAASWDDQSLASGTSLATPIVAGFLAVLKSKYPKATGDQLLQTMIRNTGGKHHAPEWSSDFGYGAISLTYMLKDDPTKYPDVNPLFDTTTPNKLPSADDVRAAGGTVGTPTPTSTEAPAAASKPSTGGGTWLPWAVGGGAAVLLLAAAIAAAMIAARRRRTAPAGVAASPEAAMSTEGAAPVAPFHDGGKA
ncbi:S8 family peptidase [Microbacterium sp. 22242]|uniref:S8 family peptidase n=1 Tax=Microbacterium sp. 22242 TaxID=3453896 RepID=UPI003F82B8BA